MFEDTQNRQSVFRSESPLSSATTHDQVIGRESEIERMADVIRPLAQNDAPDNLLVYGPPGVGKTTCVKHLFDQLESETSVKTVSINCWQYNTRPSLLTELLIQLGYPAPRKGKPVDELLSKVREWLDKNRGVAVALDEFDQLDDANKVIYDLHKACEDADNELGLVLISDEQSSELELDPRSQSRLRYQSIEFTRYDADDLSEILDQRAEEAFHPRAISDHVLELVARIVAEEGGDCRKALNMLLRAGRRADQENADKVSPQHVQQGQKNRGQHAVSA